MLKVAALVPIREHSQRVPGKNFRLFAGKPLYHHVIETLKACRRPLEVWIDTDSERIWAEARERLGVKVVRRDADLRGDEVPMNEILLRDVRRIEADVYVQTHATNPLLEPETVARAVERFLEPGGHDSLFTVTPVRKRFYDRAGRPLNHDPAVLLQTQDLPPIYEENSCLYIFTRESLESTGRRIGRRPIMFEMEPAEALDIDEELDLVVAEAVWQWRRGVRR